MRRRHGRGPDLPVELSGLLSEWPQAGAGWERHDARVRDIYTTWVARPLLSRRRMGRARQTAGWAAEGTLDEHMTRYNSSGTSIAGSVLPWG